MERSQTLHKLDILKQQNAARLEQKQAEFELERKHKVAMHENDVRFYQQLKELGTDITQIIVSQNRNPDKLIQIVNDGKDAARSNQSNIGFINQI